MIIIINPDGSQDIQHPSGVVAHHSAEFVKRLAAQAAAIRQGFIDNNPCGLHCPAGRPFSCDCDLCAERGGFWQAGERKQFSPIEQDQIDLLWDQIKGYLGPVGCRLPRKLRPLYCLAYVCQVNE